MTREDDSRRGRRGRRERGEGKQEGNRSVRHVTAEVGYIPVSKYEAEEGWMEDLGLARDCGHAAAARARLGESLMVKVEAANPSLSVEVSP